jgi:hypothetical protein
MLAGMITVVIVPSRKFIVRDYKFLFLNEVTCFPAKTMGRLPDRRCVYSDSLALGAQPCLRTSMSKPSHLGQMKAIMPTLRMATCLITNGLAAGLGHSLMGVWWWRKTTWTNALSGPAGRWERDCSGKGKLRLLPVVLFFVLPVMGNTQSGYTLTRTAATLDSFISELGPEIVYEKRYVL